MNHQYSGKASKAAVVWLFMISVFSLSGCSRSDLVQASGVVTYEGKPVTSGSIMFYPAKGRPAGSEIASDGSFNLSSYKTGDGLPPGNYTVCVTAYKEVGGGGNFDDPTKQVPMQYLVPEEYSYPHSSPCKIEVTSDSGQQLTIELPIKNG